MYVVLGKGNLSRWNGNWTIQKEHNEKCLAKKWHCLQEAQTISAVKFGGGSIMIWGFFSSKVTGELQVIHGRMNGSMYREILEKNLQKSAISFVQGRNFVLLHDNDPKHTTKLTKECFENNGIWTLNRPSQFPDSNPIGNLWNTLKVKVHKRNRQNIKQVEEICKEEWAKVTLDQCGKLVANYRKWLEAMKENRAYTTKYYSDVSNTFALRNFELW